jgi:uncharacterized LabA/DUF88 family protein
MKKLKVKVFIEGSNIYFAQKKMNKWLDWVKVKQYLNKIYHVLEIRYYVGVRKNDPGVQPFLRKLGKIGFVIIRKPVKIIVDETGKKIEKANFDVEITGDVLKSLREVNAVVIFSGDSDFDYLVKLVHEQGKQLFVYSSKKTLSWELKLSADRYFLLENLSHLTKDKRFVRI